MKIHQFLYQLFGFRISSDAEIPTYIHKMSYAGKFDEPKKNAVITEVLVRLADLEEAVSSLQDAVKNTKSANDQALPPVNIDLVPAIIQPVPPQLVRKGGRPKGSKNKKK